MHGFLPSCFEGDLGGMLAINTAGGWRQGGSKQLSAAQRFACDWLCLFNIKVLRLGRQNGDIF